MSFRDARVVVMGLGRFGGGLAAARWLARQGAEVTVTDLGAEAELAESLAALVSEPIARWRLGGHDEEDFRRADWVVVNPAVHPDSPFLQIARASRARLTSEIELFLERCRAPVVAVTGSNGKSTTAAMIAAALRAAGRRAWLGGNIGASLIECLDAIAPDDVVVLELSSFQLHYLSETAAWPSLAVVTQCAPNHLDWHGSFAAYVAAKQRLLDHQRPGDVAVLNLRDAEVARWRSRVRGRLVEPWDFDRLPELRLPGEHHRIDAALAAAAAESLGCETAAIRTGLAGFAGLPMRLEWFAVVDGRRYYNDSAATTPESTIAALGAIDGPIWLLAGGRDKGFDLDPLAEQIVAAAAGSALFGAIGPSLGARVARIEPSFPVAVFERVEPALGWVIERSRDGDAVLFSPAAASTDQYRNFVERGRHFTALVRALAGSRSGLAGGLPDGPKVASPEPDD